MSEPTSALKTCLSNVERWCFNEVLALRGMKLQGEEITRAKRPSSPFVTDFFRLNDVWIEIAFVLREKDPAYDEKSDNLLWEFTRPVHGLQFDTRQQWNRGEYLFYMLGASLPNGHADMARIGHVYADVKYIGEHLSASMSASDGLAYAPVTHHLWQDRKEQGCKRWQTIDPDIFDKHQFENNAAQSGGPVDLSEEEIAHCERINNELVSSDFQGRHIARYLSATLKARIDDPVDALEDYEIELAFEHWLHPMDRVAVRRNNRILISHDGRYSKGQTENLLEQFENEQYDWATGPYRGEFPFRHSFLFHDLYDHHYISIKDVPRIDRVCTKLEVWLQKFFEV